VSEAAFSPLFRNALSRLREAISPDLRKRMQGKSCFNFVARDRQSSGKKPVDG
jgi:hypothetical protein